MRGSRCCYKDFGHIIDERQGKVRAAERGERVG